MENRSRQSLELTTTQWAKLQQIAAETESVATRGPAIGEPSWRVLVRRIANGELLVSQEETRYYLIHRSYAGPNPDQHELDAEQLIVQGVPGITNSSHEERTEGWLGTTSDWAQYARGAYKTAAELMEFATEHFPGVDKQALLAACEEADREREQDYPDWPAVILPAVETGDLVDINWSVEDNPYDSLRYHYPDVELLYGSDQSGIEIHEALRPHFEEHDLDGQFWVNLEEMRLMIDWLEQRGWETQLAMSRTWQVTWLFGRQVAK